MFMVEVWLSFQPGFRLAKGILVIEGIEKVVWGGMYKTESRACLE